MILEPLQDLLAAEGLGTIGTNLFTVSMPAGVRSGILLLADLVGTMIDHELPGLRKGRFQVIVRSGEYLAGRQLIESVVSVLASEQLRMLDGYRYRYVRAIHDPIVFPSSDGQSREFSVNFEACYEV